MSIFKKIVCCFFALFLFIGGASIGYTLFSLSNTNEKISKDFSDLGIDSNTLAEIETLKSKNNINKDEITNIALFGIDTRNINVFDGCRSDSIIIATIDKKHNKIKLSSIMRDSYVQIDGHGYDKINHAYAFGGPELAIKTINQNFGLDIKDFVTVNFFGLEKIIDSIGGVTVNIKSNEISEINKYIKETAKIQNKRATLIATPGSQKLNGLQAVSYGRIRKVGNGDFERTDRQREIIMSMISNINKIGVKEAISLANECSSFVKTSLTIPEGIKLGIDVMQGMSSFDIVEERFPKNGEEKKINGVWYMVPDLQSERVLVQDFIYENN